MNIFNDKKDRKHIKYDHIISNPKNNQNINHINIINNNNDIFYDFII